MKPNLQKLKQEKSMKELLNFGIINIDKPSGPTSFDVSDFVRKKLSEIGVRKTSHFGTLDPKVTGVLPVALNRACKLTGFFLGEDKEYVGVMKIHEDIPLEDIKKAIKERFLGNIKQTPPKKSRVKRVEREREIKKFDILEKDGKDILFIAEVQGGTYIRKLISDLGDYLKTGAHMLELRRIRAGIFKEEKSVDLYELEKAVEEYKKGNEEKLREIIIPGEIVSEIYPAVSIKGDDLKHILTGKPIHRKDLAENEKINAEIISVFCNERFIGMYKVINKDDIFAKPEFVFQ
jgi:H/ACA ribonucleoprotein complex subunit 4